MTRGKLDLGDHKLAGLYRVPARHSKQYRKRMPKMPGGTKGVYFILWRMVDGAVRDTFERHPDYLTAKGQDSDQLSITKRVTGALMGYASQATIVAQDAQCRSVRMEGWSGEAADASPNQSKMPTDAAADTPAPSLGWRGWAKVGFGNLRWRAALPVTPEADEFTSSAQNSWRQ